MPSAREARDWAAAGSLRGIGDSLYSPCTGADGDHIDFDAYEALVRHCVGGLRHDMLWLTSGVGEWWSLTLDERTRLVKVAVEQARAIEPATVIQACTAAATAKDCLELTLHAQDHGADICFLQTPPLVVHGGAGVLRFFEYVADNPAPGRTYADRFLLVGADIELAELYPGIGPVAYIFDPREWVIVMHLPDRVRDAGLASRLDRECLVHDGFELRFDDEIHRISTVALVGLPTVVYGQQEIVKDLLKARNPGWGEVFYETSELALAGLTSDEVSAAFEVGGERVTVTGDFIAGCDGSRGICQSAVPAESMTIYSRRFTYTWLGILAKTPPVRPELVYSAHDRGFSLLSMRTPEISRLYLQVPADTNPALWPNSRIFDEVRARLGKRGEDELHDGPVLDRTLVQFRSATADPMQYGRLFLAGDAAHVFPPSAAKGLNVALADVAELAEALTAWYTHGSRAALDHYSENRLAEIWRIQDFSEWMTWLLHRPEAQHPAEYKLRQGRLRQLVGSTRSAAAFAEQYVGIR